jgi:hypothetical protein
MLSGKWTYRSFLNKSALVDGDPARALALIFGEGVFDLTQSGTKLTGSLDMGSGYALTLSGETSPAPADGLEGFAMIGLGVDGTPTAGWRYDYHGTLAYTWPGGINQVPALVGTVIRVNAHGPTSPAGVTASFIAVSQGG